MSRNGLLLLAAAFGLFAPAEECRAQFFNAGQTFVNSGGWMNVNPIATNQNRYVRMGMNVGFSQVVDVHTFSPVRGYSNLAPVNPIGFGFVRPNQGIAPIRNFTTKPTNPRPTVNRFLVAVRQFDKDLNGTLRQDELQKVATAVVAELKRSPRVYEKLKQGSRNNASPKKPITDKDVTDAFVKQCLTFDKNKDGALSNSETEVMAAMLIRSIRSLQ